MDRYLLTALTLSSWCVFYLVSLWLQKKSIKPKPSSLVPEKIKLFGAIGATLLSMTVVMGLFPETLVYFVILIMLLGILASLNTRPTIYQEIAYTGLICSLFISLLGVLYYRTIV